jgi:peptidoglycan hydrolase-like protein with peptidoglycan-binding domain
MTPSAVRFAFVAFAVLTGAMMTNIFVLQPPSRQIAGLSPQSDGVSTGASGWSSRDPQAASGAQRTAPRQDAVVPRIETGAVKPIPETTDRTDLVRAVQRELKAKGYETGSVDGVPGLVTRGAIMAYEADSALPLTAEPREALLQHLVLGSADFGASGAGSAAAPGPEAEAVIRAVQRAFRQLGYLTTLPDGRLNDATRRAIRKFETDRKLKQTGRISGELLAKLASLASDALQASR